MQRSLQSGIGQLAATLALCLIATPPAAFAGTQAITGCDTLFALRVAENAGLADCNITVVGAGRCAGRTANACRLEVYRNPEKMAPPLASTNGSLVPSYLPRCLGGTNVCRAMHAVHCLDGTRPILHADKARNAAGDFIESNRWLFYVSGGGSCFGPDCWDDYTDPASQRETSTCHPDTVNCWANGGSHVADTQNDDGILSSGPENPFAGFNRVRLNKCSYDGFQGDQWETQVAIDRDGDGKAEQQVARLFHQGHQVYRSALAYLSSPVTLASGLGPTLPPLSDAELVLLAGNSGGGKAMIMTGDLLRDYLVANVLTDPDARVRLILDAHFLPNLETEASFGTAMGPPLTDANGNGRVDTFDHHFLGVSGLLPDDPLVPPAVEFYSDWTYVHPNGRARQTLDAFVGDDLSAFDTSCLASHPDEPAWCRDEHHVLLNHVSTPFFVRMDLRDNAWITGAAVFGGPDNTGYNWPDPAFFDRVDTLARDYLDFHRLDSELALDVDASGDPGCVDLNDQKPGCWPIGLWAPARGGAGSHTGLLDPVHFGTDPSPVELLLCEDVNGKIQGTAHTVASAVVEWLVLGETIEARPFFDASAGQRTRYWVDADNATCISELNCANGLDDDGDGDVDLVDTDC